MAKNKRASGDGNTESPKRNGVFTHSIAIHAGLQAESVDAPDCWADPRHYRESKTITLGLRGEWFRIMGWAYCPICKFVERSLAITQDGDGKLLLSCNGGCHYDELIVALDCHLFAFRPRVLALSDLEHETMRRLSLLVRKMAGGWRPQVGGSRHDH
jgi:hypothetical protein